MCSITLPNVYSIELGTNGSMALNWSELVARANLSANVRTSHKRILQRMDDSKQLLNHLSVIQCDYSIATADTHIGHGFQVSLNTSGNSVFFYH